MCVEVYSPPVLHCVAGTHKRRCDSEKPVIKSLAQIQDLSIRHVCTVTTYWLGLRAGLSTGCGQRPSYALAEHISLATANTDIVVDK